MNFEMNGGQFIFAKGHAKVKAKQINGANAKELDQIIRGITDHLSALNEEDAECVKDAVDMAKEELEKPKPKVSRLKNCLSIMAPMVTVANGAPILVENLKKFTDYLAPYLK